MHITWQEILGMKIFMLFSDALVTTKLILYTVTNSYEINFPKIYLLKAISNNPQNFRCTKISYHMVAYFVG